jgi:uncharacterized membrane protein YhfC
MVVAPLTLTCLALATLFVAVLPIALYRRLRRPFGLNGRDTIAGIAVFALCAMVIERAVNGFVLHQPITAAWLSNPLTFVIYGALIAGVCQEVGRFIAMRLMWRRATAGNATAPHSVTGPSAAAGDAAANATAAKLARAARSRKTSVPSTGDSTALGYGIGHGGAEAWMVGVLVEIQWIVFAVVENRGQLETYLDNVPVDSMMRIHLILASLSPQTAGIFVLERAAGADVARRASRLARYSAAGDRGARTRRSTRCAVSGQALAARRGGWPVCAAGADRGRRAGQDFPQRGASDPNPDPNPGLNAGSSTQHNPLAIFQLSVHQNGSLPIRLR